MSSQSTDASSEDVSVAGKQMVLIEMKFQKGNEFHPWRDRVRAKEWMQEILNRFEETQEADVWKVLFHSNILGLTLYLDIVPNYVADDVIIPHIGPLLGQKGPDPTFQ